jgi:hypothetical protein
MKAGVTLTVDVVESALVIEAVANVAKRASLFCSLHRFLLKTKHGQQPASPRGRKGGIRKSPRANTNLGEGFNHADNEDRIVASVCVLENAVRVVACAHSRAQEHGVQ